jgi:hypothetical protein
MYDGNEPAWMENTGRHPVPVCLGGNFSSEAGTILRGSLTMCDVAHTQRARIMVKSTPKKFEAWVDHQNDSEAQGYGREMGSLAISP